MGKERIKILKMLSQERPQRKSQPQPPSVAKQLNPTVHCAVADDDALNAGISTKPFHEEKDGDEHRDSDQEIWREDECHETSRSATD